VAKKKTPRDAGQNGGDDLDHAEPAPGGGETTGRYLVVLSDDCQGDTKASVEALKAVAGAQKVATSEEYEEGAVDMADAAGADAVVFSNLAVAVVSGDDRMQLFAAATGDETSRIVSVEPEPIFYASALAEAPALKEYFRGYKAAVDHLYQELNGEETELLDGEIQAVFNDTAQFTWGLQATRVHTSRFSGQGTRVCVLDTGLDLQHPDFRGRRIAARSFVPNQAVQDQHGHGTHCTGTACGPKVPPGGSRRYGAAFGSDIFIGKVLSNQGSGQGAWILAGMDWAVGQQCHVISMSLGNALTTVSPAYEAAGRRALDRGSLIVAAAGNHRQTAPNPPGVVGQPANSPSILAVAALNNNLALAPFSCTSNPVTGGKVDIIGPGVDVYSTWPMPTRYRIISGTSMATPHVAGIAALWAQARGVRGAALWNLITRFARPVRIPAADAGAGLVQAPQ
jgi:subtilisin family serine protease